MEDHLERCPWAGNDSIYIEYHDKEWGVPVRDDRKQFEFLVLESAQAGLSWITILKRREGYRRLYKNFDPEIVVRFEEKDIQLMLQDTGIIRNRKKIEASINNARHFLRLAEKHESFSNYIWSFVDGKQLVNSYKSLNEVPATTPLSDKLAREMKKEGFRFLGSTTLYAHLQATGLVNDHLASCFRHSECTDP